MGDILKDRRFTKYINDPRYRQIPKHERKIKIDKRFQSMFNDDKFKVKYTIDKRGRPINESSTENLRKYYDLESDDESSDGDEKSEPIIAIDDSKDTETPGRFVRRISCDKKENEDIKNNHLLQNDKLTRGKIDKKIKGKLLDLDIDYARGEGVLLTDSSSDEASSDEGDGSEFEHEWGELDANAETTEDSTRRIAICNMDWDNIKATDIMVLLNSFLPPGGIIHSVTVYPSEYGIKRMQEEEVRGPIELTEQNDLSDVDENEEGSSYHMEKLRRYQLNRLKYYYAVVVCDSVGTADKLYSECDGMEYESSATRLDMRFIPDDVSFDQEPREECMDLPDMTKYKPRLFKTTALQQAKVELTWDTTNPNRAEVLRSALDGKIDDLGLKEYLASSSEDEESGAENNNSDTIQEQDDDPIQKYKSLLEEFDKKDESKRNKDMEMEITWGLGIKNKAEELVKKKLNDDKNMTPFEKMMQKRKQKKKEKKLKNKQAAEDINNLSDNETQSSDDIPSDIDMNDPYFAEEFNTQEFKKVKTQKNSKINKEDLDEDEEKRKAELELLLDDENDSKTHFSLKKIQENENSSKKSKRKKKLKQKMEEQKTKLPDFELNLNDERFSALYNSHHFNIDPTNPNFKKTKNMDKLIKEKLNRRPADVPIVTSTPPKRSKEDAELSLLIKNIKRKTKTVS